MTLMGTPLNMVGRAAYENAVPGDTIGIFEISRITVPAGLLMILYFCFVGSRFFRPFLISWHIPSASEIY